jgi:hypothetical protein
VIVIRTSIVELGLYRDEYEALVEALRGEGYAARIDEPTETRSIEQAALEIGIWTGEHVAAPVIAALVARHAQATISKIAQAGWGEALTIQPNDRYADRIIDAEVEARAAPRGRWSGCFEEPEPNRDSSPPPGEEDDDDGGTGSAVPDGNCSEVGITDFPVPSGDPRDRDGDGIACES